MKNTDTTRFAKKVLKKYNQYHHVQDEGDLFLITTSKGDNAMIGAVKAVYPEYRKKHHGSFGHFLSLMSTECHKLQPPKKRNLLKGWKSRIMEILGDNIEGAEDILSPQELKILAM